MPGDGGSLRRHFYQSLLGQIHLYLPKDLVQESVLLSQLLGFRIQLRRLCFRLFSRLFFTALLLALLELCLLYFLLLLHILQVPLL